MLVTLLVLWVIVVPLITVVGTYVLAGLLARRHQPKAPEPSALGVLSPPMFRGTAGATQHLAVIAGAAGSRVRDHRLTLR